LRKEVAELFQWNVARSIHDERVRDMQRHVIEAQRRDDARAFMQPRHGQRSVRRSIGRSIIRVGEAIASEAGQPMATS
jgi:hypothetical protein